MNKTISEFQIRRTQQFLGELSLRELKIAVNDGLAQLLKLVETKPKGWHDEIDEFENALAVLHAEIKKREAAGE